MVCSLLFLAMQGVSQTTIQYVSTYTWKASPVNTDWTNAANWDVITLKRDPAVTAATAPGETTASHIHNVVIPLNSGTYPALPTGGATFTVTNLNIATGATLSLGGNTLVIQGLISGGGLINTTANSGIYPSLNFDGKSKLAVYAGQATSQTDHDATFGATSYSNNFNSVVDANITGADPSLGYTFPTVGGYGFKVQALPGSTGLAVVNIGGNKAISVDQDPDDLLITFTTGDVYAFSANFSVTDFPGNPVTAGGTFVVNGAPTPATTTISSVSNVNIVVTLLGGTIYQLEGNSSGQFIGITSNTPITSIRVESNVRELTPTGTVIGYPTIDDIKLGARAATGTVSFSQGTNAQRRLRNLTFNLDNTAPLTLGNALRVYGTITPTSGILNTSASGNDANLTLESDAILGTARIASHGAAPTSTINGKVTFNRLITGGRARQWRFLGLPFSSNTDATTIGGIEKELTNNGPITPTMMRFIENNNNGSYSGGTSTGRNAGYQFITGVASSVDVLIGAGDGFAAWIYEQAGVTGTLVADQTLSAVGTLNESGDNFVKSIIFTPGGVADDRGWNLVANPFASSVDWKSANLVKANISGTMYRWDPNSASWTTHNGTAGTPINEDGIIESGASFFVKASAPSASLTFRQTSKVTTASAAVNQFSKNNMTIGIAQSRVGDNAVVIEKPEPTPAVRITASGPGNPVPTDALLSMSFEDATPGFDNKYDAYHMGRSSGAAVSINGSDKINYAMQFDRPIADNGKEKRYYPLTFTAPSIGKGKLEVNLEGKWNSLNTIHLIDKKEGKTIPLSGGKLSYEFTMVSTKEEDRFLLAVNHINISEKSGATAIDVRVMNNPVQNNVIDAIIAHPSAKAKGYSIVNGTGATLNKGAVPDNNSDQQRLNFGKSNASGVFYLKVDFENGDSKTVKFIKL